MAKRGAPIGNRNAAGPHTGLTGMVGRALGLRQLQPKDAISIRKHMLKARGLTENSSLYERLTAPSIIRDDKLYAKIVAAHKRSSPW